MDKIGLPLEDIHVRGRVPQCTSPISSNQKLPTNCRLFCSTPIDETKLHASMARFFTKMRLSKPVVRNNYFVQVVSPHPPLPSLVPSTTPRAVDPDQIGWSDTTNGPEGVFDQGIKGPRDDAQEEIEEFVPPSATADPGLVRLRQERQSLRRLRRSGAIVFTIRTYIDKMTDLANEPGVPGRLASAIRSWGEDVAA